MGFSKRLKRLWVLLTTEEVLDERGLLGRRMSHAQLMIGWSALLANLLIPMGDTLRLGALFCLFVALSFIDAIRTVREGLKD